MSLLELQRSFRRHLLDEPDGGVHSLVAPRSAGGLAVYHNAYRAQLTDCLAETYARTHAWIGGPAFLEAMREHIEENPPTGWTLGAYGEGFAVTLARLYPADPEVAELATLEWLVGRAFEAENAEALPVAAIAEVDWDKAGLAFVPSLSSALASTNAGAIWSALAAGVAPPAAKLLSEPAVLLIWRQDFSPCFRTIELIEHEAVSLTAKGLGFPSLCNLLIDMRGEAEGVALAGHMLGQWFADGLIHEVTPVTATCCWSVTF